MRIIWTHMMTRGNYTWTPITARAHREDAIVDAERDWRETHGDKRPLCWEVVATDTDITVAYPDKHTVVRVFPLRLEE